MNKIMYDFEITSFHENFRTRNYLQVKECSSNEFYHIYFDELIFLLQNIVINNSKFSHACYAKQHNGLYKLIPVGSSLDILLNTIFTKVSRPMPGRFYISKNNDVLLYLGKNKNFHFTFRIINNFDINDYQLKTNSFQSELLNTKSKQEFYTVIDSFYSHSYNFIKTRNIPTVYESSITDIFTTDQIDTLLFVYNNIIESHILYTWDWSHNIKIISSSTNSYVITIYNHWITLK